MPKFSAKQRKVLQGKTSGPHFMQFFHYVKRSTSYHGLSLPARALLTEIHDRYNGSNNGMIVLGVREAEYELRCGHGTVRRAMRELDDAGLARPTQLGAWRGRLATEWRLMWRRCDKTGDLPRSVWQERKPFVQLLLPKPKKEPLTNAERQQRWRNQHNNVTELRSATAKQRSENRNGEVRYRSTEGPLQEHRRYVRSATGAQKRNSSINRNGPRSATGAHVHIYQGHSDDEER
jgi:hypothetical protein